MGFSTISQGAGPPPRKPEPSINTQITRRTVSCLPASLVTFAKMQTWPIMLAFMPLWVGAAAHNEGLSASFDQIPAGMRSEPSGLSLFQNSTSGLKMAGQNLRNRSREGRPPLQMNLYAGSRFTNDVRATNQSHTVNAHLDSEKISVSTDLKSSQGPPSMKSVLQMDHSSSQDLGNTASLTPAKTADVSLNLPSNRSKRPEYSMTSPLVPQGVDLSTRSILSPSPLFPDLKRASHPDSNTAHQTVLVQDSSPNIDSSTATAVLTSKQLSATYRSLSHQQLPSRNTRVSWQTHSPTFVGSPHMSALPASINGTSHDPEHYKEGLLSSDVNYGTHTAGTLSAHRQLSQIAQDSTSYQPSVVETTRQWSQLSKATVELPPTKERSFVGAHHSTVESFPDLANSSITQLAKVTPTPILHSHEAGLPGFSLSLATHQPDLSRTALGTPAEVNLFPRQQSSELKEHLTSPDGTSLPLYLGSTKEHKNSSLATYDMPDTSLGEVPTPVLKEGPFHVGEDHTGPHVVPIHDIMANIRSGTTSSGRGFQSWQPPTLPPPGTLNSGDVRNESCVPLVQVSPSNAVRGSVGYKEMVNTAVSRRKEEILTAALEWPVFSDLPPATSGDAPTVRLASSLISEEPEAWLVDQHYTLPGKRSETTAPIPVGSTFVSTPRIMVTSKAPSKQDTLVVSLTTKKAHNTTVHILTPETDAALASHPYLNREHVTLPTRATFASMAYADLQTGSLSDSPVVEFLSKTSPGWKFALPTSSHDIASLLNLTEPQKSSVVAAHSSSLSFTSLGSTNGSLPASTQKINTEVTEHLMARKEQVVPVVTELPSSSHAEVWRPSSTSSPTTASTAPLLPTKILNPDLNTSAVAPTEGLTLRYKATDGSTAVVPLTAGETSLHIPSPDYADSSDSKAPVPRSITEAKSTQAFPVSSNSIASMTDQKSLPVEFKSTARMPCSHTSCMIKTLPASFTPSQPLLTRKVLVSMLGSTEGRKNMSTAVNIFEVTSPKEISTRVLSSGKTVTLAQEDYTLEEQVSKFKNPVLSHSARKEHLTPLGSSVSSVPAVRTLPLWFRLTGINYTESLEDKSSEIYKKLEKEVKLTLNKMLSAYETFLQMNILGFLNGSVMVRSEAVFRAGPCVPTPSDTIRTIVTEVETKGLDAFFDWRIDLQSLRSDGFNLSNLEPEKLAISFIVLGLRPQPTWDYLETLRIKVTSLLGARYTVLNISLVEIRNLEGDIDVSGEVYTDTDIHVDIGWALEALMGLSNDSVDLTSLSINGSRLSLHVFPVSFLVTNRAFNEKMMDRSSAEHQDLVRDLTDVLMHILSKYKNFLQVAIRDITGGSLVCRGDVIFQHPAPTSKDVLRTLAHSVGPKDYLDSSGLQVDPFSFTVAGDGLEPPFRNLGIPGYGIGVIILCVLLLVVLPILALLPKIIGRKDKVVINNRVYDPEAGVETFELDNPTFRSPVEEDDGRLLCSPSSVVGQKNHSLQ